MNELNWAKYYKGNILDYADKVDVIAHQVNCQGIMGGGLALQIKNKWFNVYEDYKHLIANYIKAYGEDKRANFLGHCHLVKTDTCYVANLFGQFGIGVGLQTAYYSLRESLENLKKLMKIHDLKSVAFPWKLGCGLAGGDWKKVLPIIEDVFLNSGLKVIFVEYQKKPIK